MIRNSRNLVFRPMTIGISANALLATIAAIGAADVSYCMLSHPGSFLYSAVRGFAFSRLLLHFQGSFPRNRSAKDWRTLNPWLNPRDARLRSRN